MKRIGLCVTVAAILAASAVLAADMGRLKLEGEGVEITLKSGSAAVTLNARDAELSAAAGKYAPASIVLTRKQITSTNGTKAQSNWKLQSAGPWGKLADLQVEPGKPTVVKVGQPLTLSVTPRQGGGSISFSFAMLGAAGETYSPLAYKDDKPNAVPPKITILDESGKVLEAGSFSFG